ncbi:hypothetical protein Nepgr_026003 [Nepenthes gracilis]|uniref:Uncharacterized protein n=1 Tax=Nepenthes gracilis TaxID=150966 RepID=A0AAD3T738_NEPGR|nr:hypothetical protein Nepgr_026003 [Nepenthes gracilis]
MLQQGTQGINTATKQNSHTTTTTTSVLLVYQTSPQPKATGEATINSSHHLENTATDCIFTSAPQYQRSSMLQKNPRVKTAVFHCINPHTPLHRLRALECYKNVQVGSIVNPDCAVGTKKVDLKTAKISRANSIRTLSHHSNFSIDYCITQKK